MPEYQFIRTRRGQLRYKRDLAPEDIPSPRGLFSQIEPRYLRPSRVTVRKLVASDDLTHDIPRKSGFTAKLAGTRDTTFRFIRSVIPSGPKGDTTSRSSSRQELEGRERNQDRNMPSVDFLRATASRGSVGQSSPLARPSISTEGEHKKARAGSVTSLVQGRNTRADSSTSPYERPVAAGNGVSVSIHLAEPLLFLQGFEQNDTSSRSTAMLRGYLVLKVSKQAKIKAVNLEFRGRAITRWPEGIPPDKTRFDEVNKLLMHCWTFFNAQFATAESGSGADKVRLDQVGAQEDTSPYASNSPVASSVNLALPPLLNSRDAKRLSLQNVQTRSLDKIDAKLASVAQKGYRLFHPGEYTYNFELPLDSRLPETLSVELGNVKYELEASVERAGTFKANLLGAREVTLVRAPSEGSLEQVEPIAISRNWEDQLHYDIVISGKSFPMGSQIPIAFKLTPLAKVQCHRVKVFITENIEYFCSNKRVHRMEPTRKVLLYEKRSDGTTTSTFEGSTQRVLAGGGIPYGDRERAAAGEQVIPEDPTNLLGRVEGDRVGPTEMELSVQLPGCSHLTEKARMSQLHFDTTYQNIQVHHWIKIVMRLSRPDTEDPTKRRHFEISIDSPFHILSCKASAANTSLPAYSSPESGRNSETTTADCACPGAPRRRISPSQLPTLGTLDAEDQASNSTGNGSASLPMRPSLARPPTAHLNGVPQAPRPIHMLRAPSFNPPSFDSIGAPPPLVTPPPMYTDIASPTAGHGLADYFSRLNATYDEDDSSDDETLSRRGRVKVPLTPGGRVNRSVDLGSSLNRRTWEEFQSEERLLE